MKGSPPRLREDRAGINASTTQPRRATHGMAGRGQCVRGSTTSYRLDWGGEAVVEHGDGVELGLAGALRCSEADAACI